MSVPHRAHGVKVLKAISSPLRLTILNLLFDKGALSYTELMNALKMNPSRDAGRFAYHLKFLLKADLLEPDAEAKKILLKAKTKYLTAQLIREVVNAILIEKGMEDYRHKLTRLGMPVHEVTALIESKDAAEGSEAMLAEAGKTVLREYTLLNVYPRDVADAQVSGAIHVNSLGTWLLKPNELMHDLR